MANVIDIIVRASDQATRVLSDVERQAGRVNTGLGGMVTQMRSLATPTLIVGGALVGMGAAAVGLAKNLADTVEQLDKVSARTGLSIESVQVYQKILEEAGGSSESLAQGLTFLSRAIATNDPLLKKYGITTKDTGEAFGQLIAMIANTTSETTRNEVAFRLLGRGSQDLVANAKELAEQFDAMKSSLTTSGGLITEKTAPAIRELDSEMDKLGRNWGGIWRGMQEAAVPAASAIVKVINEIFDAANGKGKGVPARLGMFGAFAGAGAGIIGMPGVPVTPPPVKSPSLDDNTKAITDLTKMLRDAAVFNAVPTLDLRLGTEPRISELQKETSTQAFDPRQVVLARWRTAIDDITSSANMLDETLDSLFIGLQSGFTQVFTGLLDKTQTFASAMKTLFRSLVNEILAQLARIVAARVFSFIVNLLGVPGGGAAAGAAGAGGGYTGQGGTHPNITPSARPVIQINAIDERSFAEHFRAMGGSVRITERRMAEALEG